jgi:hypothetical protein
MRTTENKRPKNIKKWTDEEIVRFAVFFWGRNKNHVPEEIEIDTENLA